MAITQTIKVVNFNETSESPYSTSDLALITRALVNHQIIDKTTATSGVSGVGKNMPIRFLIGSTSDPQEAKWYPENISDVAKMFSGNTGGVVTSLTRTVAKTSDDKYVYVAGERRAAYLYGDGPFRYAAFGYYGNGGSMSPQYSATLARSEAQMSALPSASDGATVRTYGLRAPYQFMKASCVSGERAIYYLVVYGWTYVIAPRTDLKFVDFSWSPLAFAESSWYAKSAVESDYGWNRFSQSAMYGNFLIHKGKDFGLWLDYGTEGIYAVQTFGSDHVVNNTLPAYLKDRWDRAQDARVLKHISSATLAYGIPVVLMSKAVFRVTALGDGRIDFGSSSDSSSIFYNYTTRYYKSGNGASRSTFVPNGSTCHMICTENEGRTFYFWLRADTLETAATAQHSITHDVEDGVVEMLGVFVQSPATTRTLVLAVEGHEEYGRLDLTDADGNAITPDATYVDGDGCLYASYSFGAETASVRVAPVLNAENKGLFVGYATATAGGAFDEWTRPTETFDLALPDAGSYMVLAAEFRAAGLRTLDLNGARVTSSTYGMGTGDDAGKYYEGDFEVAFRPPVGKYISSATLTRTYTEEGDEEESTETTTFDDVENDQISFAMIGDGEYSLSGTADWINFDFVVKFDEASKGHDAEMAVTYIDAEDVSQEAEMDDNGDFHGGSIYGKTVSIFITPDLDDATGVKLRRVELAQDGSVSDITSRFEPNAGRYEGTLNVTGAFTVNVFLGHTFEVDAVTRTTAAADGVASVSLAEDGAYAASVEFTYGDTVYLKATESPSATNGMFIAWMDADGTYPAGVVSGIGATAAYVPTDISVLNAVFGAASSRLYLKITNDGGTYGNIGLFAADDPADVTQLVDEEAFIAALLSDGFLPDLGSGQRNPRSIESVTPSSPGEKFYSVRPGATVIAACDEYQDSIATFNGFQLKRYIGTRNSTPVLDDGAEPFPDGSRVAFVATVSGAVLATYVSETPKRIGGFYGTTSSADCGTISLAPWPPFSGGAQNSAGVAGIYKVGTVVTVSAMAKSGWRFDGWYYDAACTSRVTRGNVPVGASFMHEVSATDSDNGVDYYVKFVATEWVPLVWEGSGENMEMEWRSRRFVGNQPNGLSCAAVEADGYPVELAAHYTSSPDAGTEVWNDVAINVASQDPRRLPMARPERFTEISVRASAPVLKVRASSSMTGLIG